MFTGKLPDPSRSWVTYESDFDLSDEDVFEALRPVIDRACGQVESAEREKKDGYGRRSKVSVPLGQVSHVRISSLDDMRVLAYAKGVNVGGAESAGREEAGEARARMCFQCRAVWWNARHPENRCPVADAQHVMES